MKYPDKLRSLWWKRAVEEPNFLVKGYEEAVERIEDHADDLDPRCENPYWHAPTEERDVIPGEEYAYDEFGGLDPDEARKAAFELLVLADLAEAFKAPDE